MLSEQVDRLRTLNLEPEEQFEETEQLLVQIEKALGTDKESFISAIVTIPISEEDSLLARHL